VHEDRVRPLSEKGLKDCALVTEFLQDKKIDAVLSSPYKRAVDTVSGFAGNAGMQIQTIEGFRERKVGSGWIEDFAEYSRKQWADFGYKLESGEALGEVQARNVAALNEALALHRGRNIIIGTHGTALSTLINHYDDTYGHDDFMAMVDIMPWVVRMDFDDNGCVGMVKVDLFHPEIMPDYSKSVVRTAGFGALKAYRFVVIFARHKGKWLYCRAEGSDSYETAGGRIEHGETPLDAAKRELFEETGAVRYEIEPAFDYSVHIPTEFSNGQVYLAYIHELGDMPDFEMAEVGLFEALPGKMRFPKILPVLYSRMQSQDRKAFH